MQYLKESFYKVLMDSVSDMVFVMQVLNDEKFIYQYLNQAAKDKTKYKNNIIGKSIYEVNTPEIAKKFYDRYLKVAQSQSVLTYQDSFICSQGKHHYSDTTLTPLVDHTQKCTHIIAVVRDITHKVHMTKKLEENEEQFRIITENAGDLITLINDTGFITYTSPSYKKILGFDHKEYVGEYFLHNVHPDDQALVNKQLMDAMKNNEQLTFKLRQYNHKNEWIWCESHVTPVFDDYDHLKHMVVVTRDISKQKEYEEKLKHFALHDSLTGLPNRRLFKKHLIDAVQNFKEKGDGLAVIMLDIDDFKDINDEMGHDIGDEVIEEYGKRVSKTITENDIVARLGGDEFVILLPNISTVDHAISIAKSIQKAIIEPWNIKGNKPKVTTSMGISIASTETTPFSILKNADLALYEAKNAGGSTYKVKD